VIILATTCCQDCKFYCTEDNENDLPHCHLLVDWWELPKKDGQRIIALHCPLRTDAVGIMLCEPTQTVQSDSAEA